MAKMEKKTLSTPDEKRSFDKGASGTRDTRRSYLWTCYSAAWMELVDMCEADRRD